MNSVMKRDHRLRLLACLTLTFCAVVFLQPPIPQNPGYHAFADQRTLLGIPHCLNVISNLAFAIVGLWGFATVSRLASDRGGPSFVRPADSVAYQVFFVAVALVGAGSAHYHLAPNNATLLWDRLPMAVAFMALLSTVIAERIDRRTGTIALLPLVACGIFSVLYWHLSERAGAGDLRYYVVVQVYPMLFVPLMAWLLPSPYTRGRDLFGAALFYALAKIAETFDSALFDLGHFVSGHTLKHLFGALGAYWLLRMLRLRRLLERPPTTP